MPGVSEKKSDAVVKSGNMPSVQVLPPYHCDSHQNFILKIIPNIPLQGFCCKRFSLALQLRCVSTTLRHTHPAFQQDIATKGCLLRGELKEMSALLSI